jgi:hypothetical protein
MKKQKVVSLNIVVDEDDAESMEYALVDSEIAVEGKFCLGTSVRDLTDDEKKLVKEAYIVC